MRIEKQGLQDDKSAPVSLSWDICHSSPKIIEELDLLEKRIKESLKQSVLNRSLMYSKDQLLPDGDARWYKQGVYAFIAPGHSEIIVYIGRAKNFKKRLLPRHRKQTMGHKMFRRAKEIYGDIIVYAFEVTDNYKKIELDLIDAFSPILNSVGKFNAKTFEVLQYIINDPGCTRQDIMFATTIGDQKREIIIDELIESGKIRMIQGISKVNKPAYRHYSNDHGDAI